MLLKTQPLIWKHLVTKDTMSGEAQDTALLSMSKYPIGIGAYGNVYAGTAHYQPEQATTSIAIKILGAKFGQDYLNEIAAIFHQVKTDRLPTFDYLHTGTLHDQKIMVTPNLSTPDTLCITLNNYSDDLEKCMKLHWDKGIVTQSQHKLEELFENATDTWYFLWQVNHNTPIVDSIFFLLNHDQQDVQLLIGDFDNVSKFDGDLNELYDLNFSLMGESMDTLRQKLSYACRKKVSKNAIYTLR